MTTADIFTPVQDRIHFVEERMRAHVDGHHPELHAALDHLLSSGGKRIRPAVSLLTGALLGADPEHIVTLAAAIELLHTATLVHDDLIDGALIRRGNATLNAQWTPAATVLTGDYIFARAAELASETNNVHVMNLFAKTLATIVNGEIQQLFNGHGVVSREAYFKRIYSKTASMFELATTAAAILSPVDQDIIDAMKSYGYEIGMAFQIIDDVLDFTGEQKMIGKPIANDLRQGLFTLPALNYFEIHPDEELLDAVTKGSIIGERMLQLIDSICTSDAIELSVEEAVQYSNRAVKSLKRVPQGPEQQALVGLAEYVVHRRL